MEHVQAGIDKTWGSAWRGCKSCNNSSRYDLVIGVKGYKIYAGERDGCRSCGNASERTQVGGGVEKGNRASWNTCAGTILKENLDRMCHFIYSS